MSSSQLPGDGNMPNTSGEGVIPASFFDMPIEYGGGDANMNMDFGSMPGFPAADATMPNASDFDAMTAQIAATIPSLNDASSFSMAGPSYVAQAPQPYPSGVPIKMEIDNPGSFAASPSATSESSTPKPSASKAKKPAKPKTEEAEGKPKPKKPKKKPADAANNNVVASSSTEQASKDAAASPAPKAKKASKKKAADKAQTPSTMASPAEFATPASPSKDTKPKSKKAGTSKAGAKSGGKARSSTARSASRMSSIGRDAATPGASRVGSQRPHDEADDDDEPAHNPQATAAEEDEAEDEEGDADDGVEELGRDHFSTQEAIYAAQQRNMGLLSMVMDEDQLDRHMASRRGALNKTSVRKLVNHVLSQSVSQHVAMVVSGVAKIFVGEIIEKAREIQSVRGESGPLRPNHLREAHRQYYLKRERPGHYPPGTNTGLPGLGKRRRLF
ncbi:Transcription initiation factor TFIID subunit 11 [Pseudozyma hubeiensis]|nr:Transcription initiation factor TFIID subunit 11 [Pseudozyma hubeiensis]